MKKIDYFTIAIALVSCVAFIYFGEAGSETGMESAVFIFIFALLGNGGYKAGRKHEKSIQQKKEAEGRNKNRRR